VVHRFREFLHGLGEGAHRLAQVCDSKVFGNSNDRCRQLDAVSAF
jgi:hypothetical protein